VQQTKALMAAAAAIEAAAQSAQEGTLVSGDLVTADLATGLHYEYTATYLASDGDDNDDDGLTDEADERAFEVIALGRHALARKRLSALVIEPERPPTITGAILALGKPTIRTSGNSMVNGQDTMISGLRGNPALDVEGIATEPPNIKNDLVSRYTQNGTSSVIGLSPTPSFGVLPAPFNLPGLVSVARNKPDNIIPAGTSNGAGLGQPVPGGYKFSYCESDLHISSTQRGAGILLVVGNLSISGSFRFDGMVIVLGNLTMSGSAMINGGVVQGPRGTSIMLGGGSRVRYSSEALRLITPRLTQVFLIDGWREIGR
jgi:hypothetical protein